VTHRERVLRGDVVSEHLVQLYDEPESRSLGVATYLYQAWRSGAPMLVVARPANWTMISVQLEVLGCPVAATIAEGRLVVLDAETTLAGFMRDGQPDPALYVETVGAVVSRLAHSPGLHIYGEMVDIMAGLGNLEGANALEVLWNELGARESFTLLCGYTSAHFGDPRDAVALHRICRAHTRAEAYPGDLLGAWLLNGRQTRFHTEQDIPEA